MANGMQCEFMCPSCRLRVVWTYRGPPGVAIWFEQVNIDAANAYLVSPIGVMRPLSTIPTPSPILGT